MVTTVGTSGDFPTLIENMIYLERDAIAAYDATIERLEGADARQAIADFRNDHHRHLAELTQLAATHGAKVPAEGDMKQLLTTGKVKLAGVVGGDGMVLKAMSSNETDTVDAYAAACENAAVPIEAKPVFERGLADERRHKTWMDAASERS
jgi:Uncharacterized conserved protein